MFNPSHSVNRLRHGLIPNASQNVHLVDAFLPFLEIHLKTVLRGVYALIDNVSATFNGLTPNNQSSCLKLSPSQLRALHFSKGSESDSFIRKQ